METFNNIKITAVVLNYNSSEDSDKCISYLKQQNYKNLSIVLVDNASTKENEKDNLENISKKYNIKYIENDKNNGFSAGNNVGIRYALSEENGEADWCLIINPDVELRDPNYINKVLINLNEKKWEKVAVIGTDVYLPSGIQQNPLKEKTVFEEMFYFSIKLLKKIFHRNKTKSKDLPEGYCEKLMGCCFFISSDFIKKVGFLDENVFLYCEESILASQVKNNGYRELYLKNIIANHEHYEKKKEGSRNNKMQIMLNSRIYWLKKYSNYNTILKNIIILFKKIQGLISKIVL